MDLTPLRPHWRQNGDQSPRRGHRGSAGLRGTHWMSHSRCNAHRQRSSFRTLRRGKWSMVSSKPCPQDGAPWLGPRPRPGGAPAGGCRPHAAGRGAHRSGRTFPARRRPLAGAAAPHFPPHRAARRRHPHQRPTASGRRHPAPGEAGTAIGTWAGVSTPCSGTRTPRTGRTPSAKTGPAPADWTPTSSTWSDASPRDAPASPSSTANCFALHLLRDLDAVIAGLTLDWSSGSIEGAVNRIKKIKRQLYGRAGFELLRKMILLQ